MLRENVELDFGVKGKECILVFTNAYPYEGLGNYGLFVADQVRRWRSMGVDVDLLFINGRESRWNYLGGFFKWFWKAFWEQGRYDAVVVHHSYCCIIAGIVRMRGVPIVYQVHDGTVYFSWMKRFLVRLALRLANEVIFVSEDLPYYLGCRSNGVRIIPCGVDLEMFRHRPRHEARRILGWELDEEIVLYAAKERAAYERYDLVLAAADQLRREGRIIKVVRLEGVVRESVPIYLNGCDVLVVASRGEGSPVIVKEALACDTPVVALRVGNVPRLLEGVESGFLCEANPVSVADQLKKALALHGAGTGRSKVEELSIERTSAALLEACRAAFRRNRHKGVRV